MKKMSILIAALFVTATIFTSCSKDEPVAETVNLGKATITGKVFMDYNTKTTLKEAAPVTAKIIAKVNTSDFVQDVNYNGNGVDSTYTAIVNAAGEYTLTIDAGAHDVIVNITAIDLAQELYTTTAANADTNYRKVWKADFNGFGANTTTVTVTENSAKIIDFEYK